MMDGLDMMREIVKE